MRDRCRGNVVSRSQCGDILKTFCTGQAWDHEIFDFTFYACTYVNNNWQIQQIADHIVGWKEFGKT